MNRIHSRIQQAGKSFRRWLSVLAASALAFILPGGMLPVLASGTETVLFCQNETAPEWVSGLNAAQDVSQMILVAVTHTGEASLTMYELSDGQWIRLLQTSAQIGRNGIGKTTEGDGRTPTGQFSFTVAFGNNADPGAGVPYLQVDSSFYWVDDPGSLYYNHLVSTKTITSDWSSAEHLSEYPSAYAYALALDYNASCVPGAGSAIFLHCSTGSVTSGCIAVSQEAMIAILQNLRPDCAIIIDYIENLPGY